MCQSFFKSAIWNPQFRVKNFPAPAFRSETMTNSTIFFSDNTPISNLIWKNRPVCPAVRSPPTRKSVFPHWHLPLPCWEAAPSAEASHHHQPSCVSLATNNPIPNHTRVAKLASRKLKLKIIRHYLIVLLTVVPKYVDQIMSVPCL